MGFLLYHPSTRPSGRRLGDFLGIPHGTSYPSDSDRPDFLVRWGSRRSVPYRPSVRTFNRKRMLDRYSGRFDQLKRLRGSLLPVPFYSQSPPAGGYVVPWLGRSNRSTRGEDITLYENGGQAQEGHDLYVKLVPKRRQFRAHVILGQRVRVRELIPSQDAEDTPIWSYENGWVHIIPDDLPRWVAPYSAAAVQALGWDFGTVDIIESRRAEPFILEVNSGPGLSDASLEWWAENLAFRLGIEDFPGWDVVEREDDDDSDDE